MNTARDDAIQTLMGPAVAYDSVTNLLFHTGIDTYPFGTQFRRNLQQILRVLDSDTPDQGPLSKQEVSNHTVAIVFDNAVRQVFHHLGTSMGGPPRLLQNQPILDGFGLEHIYEILPYEAIRYMDLQTKAYGMMVVERLPPICAEPRNLTYSVIRAMEDYVHIKVYETLTV